MRGKPGFAHFAAAKAGLRMIAKAWLANSARRAFTSRTSSSTAASTASACTVVRPEALKERGEDGLLGIEAIADTFWHIHRQPKSAWAQEVDLRPFKEPF